MFNALMKCSTFLKKKRPFLVIGLCLLAFGARTANYPATDSLGLLVPAEVSGVHDGAHLESAEFRPSRYFKPAPPYYPSVTASPDTSLVALPQGCNLRIYLLRHGDLPFHQDTLAKSASRSFSSRSPPVSL